MQGLHLMADVQQCRCDPKWLTDAAQLEHFCLNAVMQSGLTIEGKLLHQFPSTPLGQGGITATILLAESHLCLHTWPEISAVTLDVYVCNYGGDNSAKARALMEKMIALFEPSAVDCHALQRGQLKSAPHANPA